MRSAGRVAARAYAAEVSLLRQYLPKRSQPGPRPDSPADAAGQSDASSEPDGWCSACKQPVPLWGPGPGGRPNAQCPHCLSLERHRFLATLLRDFTPLLRTSRQVVEFAPQPQVRRVLSDIAPELPIIGTDLMDTRWIDFAADGCFLPLRTDSIDVIISFHVLEHIPDDRAAMREIARVLSPGGLFIMQVPYRGNVPTDEDFDASPEERVRRFGQDDHVRFYGNDLDDRLSESGLDVSIALASERFDDRELERLNFPGNSRIWICRPSR